MSSLVWAFALQILAFLVLFAEVMIPSFGILTVVALGLGAWSWYFIASGLPAAGIAAFAVADAVLVPLAAWYGLRRLGRSPVAHLTNVGAGDGLEASTLTLRSLVGREAVAETALRPSGKIRIDGDVHDARSEGEFVDRGAAVRIVSLRGAEFLIEKIQTPESST